MLVFSFEKQKINTLSEDGEMILAVLYSFAQEEAGYCMSFR